MDKTVLHMVHDLERMAIYFRSIKTFIDNTDKNCPARKDFLKIVAIYDKIMDEGCQRLEDD